MEKSFNIQSLVDDLSPVRAANPLRSMSFPIGAMLLAVAAIITLFGVREDIITGSPNVMLLLRSGTLLLLGLTSSWAVVHMASPSVGRHDNGWKIALVAAALFPLAALFIAMQQDPIPSLMATQSGMQCLRLSLISGLIIAIPMVLILRNGAPTSPNLAGLVTGVASGGLGAFVYNIHCPVNNVIYIGFWYTIVIVICAVAGRIIVPRLIRW